MAELKLAYEVSARSTGSLGRAICKVRDHAYVADGSGGEMVGAGELFLSGIAACAVNMVEGIAHTEEIALDWMDVSVSSYRDADANHGDLSLYDGIRVNFEMWGVDDDQAHQLVDTWKRR